MATVGLRLEIDSEGNVSGIEKIEDGLENVQDEAKQAAQDLQKVGRAADELATGAMAVGAVVMTAAYGMVQAASGLEEAQNKVSVVFGEGGKAVLAWSEDSAEAMGLSSRAALQAAGDFAILFSSMESDEAVEMSEGMVQLAADMASFNDINPEDALISLRAGLVGEAEPLRRLGILINEATVKTKGMELGLADANGELSEGAKIQARYALIMEQSTKQQGDFARTADGAANMERILKAQLEDTAAVAGGALKDSYTALLGAMSPVLKATADFAATSAGQTAIKVAVGLGAMALAAGGAYKAAVGLKGVWDAAGSVAHYLSGKIGAGTDALGAQASAIDSKGVPAWGRLKNAISGPAGVTVALLAAIALTVKLVKMFDDAHDNLAELQKEMAGLTPEGAVPAGEKATPEQRNAQRRIEINEEIRRLNKERAQMRGIEDWTALFGIKTPLYEEIGGAAGVERLQERYREAGTRRGELVAERRALNVGSPDSIAHLTALAAERPKINVNVTSITKIGETELRTVAREESYEVIEETVRP